jgi:hypothetical protein
MLVTSTGTIGIALRRVLDCGHSQTAHSHTAHSQTAHLPRTISSSAGDRRTDIHCVRFIIREVREPVSTSKSHLQAKGIKHVQENKIFY